MVFFHDIQFLEYLGPTFPWGFFDGSVVKNPPAKQEMWVQSLNQVDLLEKVMAPHSSILVHGNPMDSGAWQVTVRKVSKSQTPLSE